MMVLLTWTGNKEEQARGGVKINSPLVLLYLKCTRRQPSELQKTFKQSDLELKDTCGLF